VYELPTLRRIGRYQMFSGYLYWGNIDRACSGLPKLLRLMRKQATSWWWDAVTATFAWSL
jgi:hypothetical protein